MGELLDVHCRRLRDLEDVIAVSPSARFALVLHWPPCRPHPDFQHPTLELLDLDANRRQWTSAPRVDLADVAAVEWTTDSILISVATVGGSTDRIRVHLESAP
jgi:hypothetical protein